MRTPDRERRRRDPLIGSRTGPRDNKPKEMYVGQDGNLLILRKVESDLGETMRSFSVTVIVEPTTDEPQGQGAIAVIRHTFTDSTSCLIELVRIGDLWYDANGQCWGTWTAIQETIKLFDENQSGQVEV